MRVLPALVVAVLSGSLAACGGKSHAPAPAPRASTPEATATATIAAAKGARGWGSQARYVGRYRLVTTEGADDGQLTLFLRTVFAGQPAVPSGIMALHGTQEGTNIFYLTDLVHSGDQHLASLHAGSFDGPVVGQLTDVTTDGGQLGGAVRLRDRTLQVRFRRFSANPHP